LIDFVQVQNNSGCILIVMHSDRIVSRLSRPQLGHQCRPTKGPVSTGTAGLHRVYCIWCIYKYIIFLYYIQSK
jgi:hypothetical protein